MIDHAMPAPQTGASRANFAGPISCLLIIMIALASRGFRIGDPAIDMDEQFYLLVADRMWHGAMPYIDIWDRKPIGLFLIYAILRPLSSDGIIAYQIGALIAATATALVLRAIAKRYADDWGATLAAVAYLVYLPLVGGAGGQAPVFYNLPMAIGALLVLRAGEAKTPRNASRAAFGAMMFAGLAIQVKYTAIFEGIAFGCWLLKIRLQQDRSLRRSCGFVLGFIATALTPTLVAALAYAALGHFHAFFVANFVSIFQVEGSRNLSSLPAMARAGVVMAPLLTIAAWSALTRLNKGTQDQRAFILLWAAWAIFGFFALGNFYNHYALPLLTPLAILSAPLLAERRLSIPIMALLGIWYSIGAGWSQDDITSRHQRQIAALAEAMAPYASTRCAYIYDGPTILYLVTRACLVTPYIFPEHLNRASEAKPSRATQAMGQLLARRPGLILMPDKRLDHLPNLVTETMLKRAITRDYQRTATLADVYGRKQLVYVRKDLVH
ncbi:hypothetical protein BH10PSE12_BH10PSE12_12260 [soil metagenome]